jgi:hypothetical protein
MKNKISTPNMTSPVQRFEINSPKDTTDYGIKMVDSKI